MSCKLSIIIPCFNSSTTLREAFESAIRQGFSQDQFEIIIINDGSTDETQDTIEEISKNIPNVKILRNIKNLGGGAARNIAIKKSVGKYIFCLDSDDILKDQELLKMTSFLEKKGLDAVCFNKCEKFSGKNIHNIIRTDIFSPLNENLKLSSLIFPDTPSSYPLYINFLYKREVFDVTLGYPEEHGFDTQNFAWRFIMNGFKARICPTSVYTQRINYNKSYYLREYEAGKVNYNWHKILIEHLYIFNDETKKYILTYPLDDPFSNIIVDLRDRKDVFISDVNKILTKDYRTKLKKSLNTKPYTNNEFENIWIIQELIKEKNYPEAKKIIELFEEKTPYPIINEYKEICNMGLNGYPFRDIMALIDRKRRYVIRGDKLDFMGKVKRIIKKWFRKYKK